MADVCLCQQCNIFLARYSVITTIFVPDNHHNMKIYLCLLFFFSGLVRSNTQTVIVSDEMNVNNDRAYFLIGKYDNKMLLLRDKSDAFSLTAFDENMRTSWNKDLELDKKTAAILEALGNKSIFNVIYKYRSKNHTIVKQHQYNPNGDLIDSITIKDYGSRFSIPEPELLVSEDKKKILLYHYEKPNILEVMSFDTEQMRVLWQKNIVLSSNYYFDSNELMDMLLDNSGALYIILSKNNDWDRRDQHFFEVYRHNDSTEVEPAIVSMQDYLTHDVHFDFDNTRQQLVAGGFYAEKNRARAIGYYRLSVPASNLLQFQLHFEPFEPEFIARITGKPNSDQKGIPDALAQQIVFRKDGGMIIIGEQVKRQEREVTYYSRNYYVDRNGSHSIVDYNHDNLFLLSLNPDGSPHWKTVLFKKQYSQDQDVYYASYFLIKTATSLRLLFNDDVKSNTTVFEYIISPDGHNERHSLFSTDNLDLHLRIADALQVAANEVIIPSEYRARVKLVKVVY